jgi:hypothetical protein
MVVAADMLAAARDDDKPYARRVEALAVSGSAAMGGKLGSSPLRVGGDGGRSIAG